MLPTHRQNRPCYAFVNVTESAGSLTDEDRLADRERGGPDLERLDRGGRCGAQAASDFRGPIRPRLRTFQPVLCDELRDRRVRVDRRPQLGPLEELAPSRDGVIPDMRRVA